MGMHTFSFIKQGQLFPKGHYRLADRGEPLFRMLIYTVYCLMFDFMNLVGISIYFPDY